MDYKTKTGVTLTVIDGFKGKEVPEGYFDEETPEEIESNPEFKANQGWFIKDILNQMRKGN